MNGHLSCIAKWLALALALAGLCNLLPAQTTSTGIIEGRVYDVISASYVQNARVLLVESGNEFFTDQFGYFLVNNAPIGPVHLKVSYTGLATQEKTIAVSASDRTRVDFSLGRAGADDPVTLDRFIVQASRDMSGASIAINEQRYAKAIKSVLSTDTFGDIANGNVADFAKFIPGVTVDGDQYISVGGVPYHATPVMVDGFPLASAAARNETRAVDLQQVSVNNMSRLEIARSQNADSPAAAIGGTVNMVPKSAFERRAAIYTIKAFTTFNDLSFKGYNIYRPQPNFDLSAVVPASANFGFALNISRLVTDSGTQGVAPSWVPTVKAVDANYPLPAYNAPYLGTFEYFAYPRVFTRPSIGFTADWRVAHDDVISVGFQYQKFEEDSRMRDRIIFNIGKVASYGPTYTQGVAGSGYVQMNHDWSDKGGRTYMPFIKWRHTGPVWEMDARGAYSNATSRTFDVDRGSFQNANSFLRNVTIRFDNPGYYEPEEITVTDAAGNAVDPYDIRNYKVENNASSITAAQDERRSFQAYVARNFDTRIAFRGKLGTDIYAQTRDLERQVLNFNYYGADGKARTADDSAAQWVDADYLDRGPGWAAVPRNGLSAEGMWATYLEHEEYFSRPDGTQAGNWRTNVNAGKRITETIYAPYLRFDTSSLLKGRMVLAGGVRYEFTETSGVGPLVNSSAIYQRDSSGKIVLDGAGKPVVIAKLSTLAGAKLAYTMRGAHAKRTYGDLFPSLNAAYSIRENLVGRFSFARSIARPDFRLILPGANVPDETSSAREITLQNPALEPWKANSFGVSLEYYFGQPSDGVISARWFVRDIQDFWGTISRPITTDLLEFYGLDPDVYGPDKGYTVTTTRNVGKASIRGTEFEYRQNLNFLPRWARGISVFANATFQDLSGNPEANFTGFVRRIINYGAAFNRQRFTLRTNVNMRGRERLALYSGVGAEEGTYNYRAPATYIDANVDYRFTRYFAVYGSVMNLLDEYRPDERYGPSTPSHARLRTLGDKRTQFAFGVRGGF